MRALLKKIAHYKRSLYNLRTALLVFALLPFVLLSVFIGWFSLQTLEADARAGMEEDIQLIARAIRLPLSHALEHGHSGTLRRTLTSAFDMDQVYGIYVYDRHGQRISSSGTREALVQGPEAADLASQGDEQTGFEEVAGEEVFSYFMPLTDSGGRINGLLQVTRRGSDFAHHLDTFRARALTLMILSALLALGLIWVGYHYAVGRHIHHTRQAMQRVADGDLSLRVDEQGPTEIRFLAQGINAMLDGIAASERELTKRREQEQALKAQLYESEKLAAIGRFAAGVAHELGSPLSVADGKTQRALRKADEPTARTLEQIRQQLQRMERIIRQLMDFARPVTPERRSVRIADLVQTSLAQVEDERCRQNVEIEQRGADPQLRLSADRLRLEQALINLLRNALQAAPGGRVLINWQRPDAHCVVLSVEDSGPGIAPDVQSRLLEPFVTTKSAGQGTGLGLAVVDAVAHEHRGHIAIGRSDQLGGARLSLYLPVNGEDVS